MTTVDRKKGDALMEKGKKRLKRMKCLQKKLAAQANEHQEVMCRITKKISECEGRMEQCGAEIAAKKKELEYLEEKYSDLESEKNRLKENARAKCMDSSRARMKSCWLELAILCVEFLVKSERASATEVIGLMIDLLRKSTRPGNHLAMLYGRGTDATDVEALQDWPARTKKCAIECWTRVSKVAPIAEVEYAKNRFQRSAIRWIDGNKCTRDEKAIRRIGKEWDNFCKAAIAAQKALEGEAQKSNTPQKADGFTDEDRKRLFRIEQVTIFGKTPNNAQIACNVRRNQVQYGAELYRRPTKYDKGFSYSRAAKAAIENPNFRNARGAYSHSEEKSLAQAIRRNLLGLKPASAT